MRAATPPATLVRLDEADVVRLCGLEAAAAGLELAARSAVSQGEREGGRLRAVVEDSSGAHQVWVEPGETAIEGARWRCDCPAAVAAAASAEGSPYALGCAHVAAVLSAWVRHPADYALPIVPGDPPLTPVSMPVERLPSPPEEQLTQPRLLRSPARPRGTASLADELARLPAADLSALARRVLHADLRDAEARTALGAALRSPAVLDPLLARLGTGPRTLLAQVLLLGGAVTAADLEGIATRSGCPASALHAEMAALARYGLVFAASAAPPADTERVAARSWRQINGWRVPTDLRQLSPVALPIPAAATRTDGAPMLAGNAVVAPDDSVRARGVRSLPARVMPGDPRPLLLALALLPRAPGPLNPFAAVGMPGREVTPIERASAARPPFPLVPGDLPPGPLAGLARGLGVASGLAQLARRLLLWAREAGAGFALHDLARLPAAELPLALRAAFAVWRGAELPAELADLALPGSPIGAGYDTAHPALRPASLAAEVAAARDFALRLLAAMDEGVWYRVDDLVELVWRTAPLFLRGRQSAYATPAWWLRAADDPRPLRPGVRTEWEMAEGRYLAALLAGPPHWLGALDLAYASDGRLFAVRVTPLGTFLLGLRETPGRAESNRRGRGGRGREIEEDRAGVPGARDERPLFADGWGAPVQAAREGRLAAQPLAAGAELLDAIEVWARPEAVAGGRIVYRLAADRACAALDAGIAPDGLLARLEVSDVRRGTRIAPEVRARLEAWQAAYGASRIEAGWALLEARDAAVLAETLAASPEIAARCLKIAPAVALVPDADAPTLRTALARRGFQV